MEISSEKNKPFSGPADYETAILATGYGRFNYALIILTIPACFAITFVTTVLSLVLPIAQCDLQLTIYDRGLLNASIYAGMISLAFLWGYLADTLGRRKLLIYGYFLNAICDIAIVFTQKMWYLMLFKFLSGCIMSGPFAVLMSFLSEFHSRKHRDRVMLNVGLYCSIGNIMLSLLAFAVLPYHWNIELFKDFIVLHSWHIFLLISALPGILSLIMIYFFPESPKFLMSRGRNTEALAVLRTVYHMNTGQPKSSYPINELINELQTVKCKQLENGIEEQKSKGFAAFRSGWSQIVPLFHKPYLSKGILVFLIQFLLLIGLNTLRLWVPQLFVIFDEYESNKVNTGNSTNSVSLCYLLEEDVRKSKQFAENIANSDLECSAVFSGDAYLKAMYVGIVTLLFYFVVGKIIKFTGNRAILIIVSLISGVCGFTFYWVNSSFQTLVLSSIYVSLQSVASQALVGVAVCLFPTSLRTMAVSLCMMFGRLGSLIGNLLLPFLLSLGCSPPFLLIGIITLLSGVLCFLLPETKETPLE